MRTVALAVFPLLLAGCLADVSPVEPSDAAPAEASESLPSFHVFTGRATAVPGAPAEFDFPFEVGADTRHIRAEVSWTRDAAAFDAVLLDPAGGVASRGFAETATSRGFTTVLPPAPGMWTLRVTATRAVEETFVATVHVVHLAPRFTTIRDAFGIEPRLPVAEVARLVQHGGYAEINLILEENASIFYAWESDRPVYFNLHYHGEDGTVRPVEGTAALGSGRFTAPFAEVFSLLWRNEGAAHATVEVVVEGVFREHSRTR